MADKGPSVWRHFDVSLAVAVLGISLFGTLMVYSASASLLFQGISQRYYVERQLVFVAIGVVAMLVVAAIDYHHYHDLAPVLYFLGLLSLIALFAPGVGDRVRGAQAWIQLPGGFQLEPSEFAKVILIVSLAAFMTAKRRAARAGGFGTLTGAVALAAIPMVLIYKQPDLGTALVLGVVLISMLIACGTKGRYVALLAVLTAGVIVAALHFGVLKRYQTERLTSFLTPGVASVKNAAVYDLTYQVNQSKIAISSGGLRGKGLYQGGQTNLGDVPEQRTDFIFTAVGEQLGLVGSAGLLLCFAFVAWRIYRTSMLSRDDTGMLISVGVLVLLVFEVFENIGMTLGIMPVAGIPLPFMSYGGSALVGEFMAIGLVLNVQMRRNL